MHGLSTILSLLFKLLGKIFRTFGINAILVIFFVIEIIACVGYAEEMSDYDKNRYDYELKEVESVVELDRNDPMLKQYDMLTSDHDRYYLVRIKINNHYSERLAVPAMSAETEDGELVVATRITYYGNDMRGEHSVTNYIPEGTQTVLTYIIELSDYRLEQSNVVKMYDYRGSQKQSFLIELPK